MRWQAFSEKAQAVEALKSRLHTQWIRPDTVIAKKLTQHTGIELARERRFSELLKMPEVRLVELLRWAESDDADLDAAVIGQVEVQGKYAGYLDRQQQDIERTREQHSIVLPDNLDYSLVKGLSNEVRQKLAEHRPETIAQASRLSGMTPAAISLLLVHLKKRSLKRSA
jgi:tRNA uridine 5-carboxymethylaminomethyl modification enzyme